MKALSCPQHFFLCLRVNNIKVNGMFWLEFDVVWDFMPVLVTSKFDEDLIQHEGAQIVYTNFLHYKSVGKSQYSVLAGNWTHPRFYTSPSHLQVWQHSNWAASSEFVSSSIPSWQILTAHAQPFREARDLAFCLKVPLDSLLIWASSGGSGVTARMLA